ncbi:MAG: mechanosensitive ion channel family protein [Nitrososphaerales archaeon]
MISQNKFGRLIAYSIAFIVLLVVVGIVLYYALYVYDFVPFSFSVAVKLAVALALGYFVITFLGREIKTISSRFLGERRGSMAFVVYRFVSYIVLALVLLGIAGISGTALLAGGTFAGLVLGLAGQTVLSNIIAGIMVIIARPYEVDDRITFFSWQYGVIAPAYPPKFNSQDFLMPGYSGRVLDIGLAYTILQLDDGTTMKIPNSVMVVAAVVSHELKERWVRTKYEVSTTLDPKDLVPALVETLKKNEWITNRDSLSVLINVATPSSYVLSIDAICKGNFEDPPRSSILLDIMNTVKALSAGNLQTTK